MTKNEKIMKKRVTNDFRTERRNLIKDSSISSKIKVQIIFELVQHINFYNETNKAKLKRFFRKNIRYFQKTYDNFEKFFSLDKFDDEKRKRLTFAIIRDLDSFFKHRDYKSFLIMPISAIIHIFLFLLVYIAESIDILQIFNEIDEYILIISCFYFIYSGFSLLLVNEEYSLLTRSREKIRIFLDILDKLIYWSLIGLYFASWFLLLSYISPTIPGPNFIIKLVILFQIFFHIFPIIDIIIGHNLVAFDKSFLYLTHLIILLKSRYKNYNDIPYFFKKLLDCLNQEFIRNFRVRIKNQEVIESSFLRTFFTGQELNLKMLRFKLEMINNEIEDVEIESGISFSLNFTKEVINKLEELPELIGNNKFEFANITFWERLFMKTEKNTVFIKMIYPLIMGALIALIGILFRIFLL